MSVLALQGWLRHARAVYGVVVGNGGFGVGRIALGRRDVDQPDMEGFLHECGGCVVMMQPLLCCAALGNGHSKVHG